MARLIINNGYIEMLILKVRAFMAKEDGDDEASGSDGIDDDMREVLENLPGDLSREEISKEIEGLDDGQQAELVALMWLGRGDGEPDEWDSLIAQARERHETQTNSYLLGEPLVADYWAEGLDRLGLGGRVDEVEEI